MPGAGGYTIGQSFTVIDAGAPIATDFAALSNTGLFFVTLTGAVDPTDSTNYIVTVLPQLVAITDLTENQQEVAEVVTALGAGSGDLGTVLAQLNTLTAAQAPKALDDLAPEINADMATPAIADAQGFQSSIFDRLVGLPSPGFQGASAREQLAAAGSVADALAAAPAPALPATGPWAMAVGELGWVDADQGEAGSHNLDYGSGGARLGFDGMVGEDAVAGLALGYTHSVLGLDDPDQSGAIDSFRAAVYGRTQTGPTWLSGLVGYGFHLNELERQISFAAIDRKAEADYVSHEFDLAGEAGYPMALGGMAVEPVAGLAYTMLADQAYEENGAGGASLDVEQPHHPFAALDPGRADELGAPRLAAAGEPRLGP